MYPSLWPLELEHLKKIWLFLFMIFRGKFHLAIKLFKKSHVEPVDRSVVSTVYFRIFLIFNRSLTNDNLLYAHWILIFPLTIYIYLRITITRKSGKHLHTKLWTAVSTLSGLISSALRDLHYWRSNQQPQYQEAEILPLGHWFMPHIIDGESTSHRELRDHFDLMCLKGK